MKTKLKVWGPTIFCVCLCVPPLLDSELTPAFYANLPLCFLATAAHTLSLREEVTQLKHRLAELETVQHESDAKNTQ